MTVINSQENTKRIIEDMQHISIVMALAFESCRQGSLADCEKYLAVSCANIDSLHSYVAKLLLNQTPEKSNA